MYIYIEEYIHQRIHTYIQETETENLYKRKCTQTENQIMSTF